MDHGIADQLSTPIVCREIARFGALYVRSDSGEVSTAAKNTMRCAAGDEGA